MGVANFDLPLAGEWYYHDGAFAQKARMVGPEYHKSSKAGGALSHLDGFDDPVLWRTVLVPHDRMMEDLPAEGIDATPGCRKRGAGWYKKSIDLPDGDIESARLVFDGVRGVCEVYVNGTLAARHTEGYTRFSCEVGDLLLPCAENEIAVFVDSRRHEGWWYEGAGIVRPATLMLRPYLHFDRENFFVRTERREKAWALCVSLPLAKDEDGVSVSVSLLDANGNSVFSECKQSFTKSLAEPVLWSPDTPYLYTLNATLTKEGSVVDCLSVKVGFRKTAWSAAHGLLLNGERYPVKGVCCHEDHAGLGVVVPPAVEEYRILRLKSMGVNAIRTAHHAPSESLLDACDRLGLFVMVENRHFDVSEDTLCALRSLVKLARNHPSVLLYCLYNEEPWQEGERGKRIFTRLRDEVRALDPERPVTGSQNTGHDLTPNAAEAHDVIGINYATDKYPEYRLKYPDRAFLGTENAPTFATRGVYAKDVGKQVFADDALDYPSDFTLSLGETMEVIEGHPYVAGCFVWSGFDHGGEPNPYEYPSVSSHWGILDGCGYEKSTAKLLRAYYLDTPVIAIGGHWNHSSGETVRVHLFTNAPAAELFLNGKSLGTQEVKGHRCAYDIPFEAGTLRAEAKREDVTVAEAVLKTAGVPAQLSVIDVSPNASVRIFDVSLVDADGVILPDAMGEVRIQTDEDTVLGVGNGDPNGHFLARGDRVSLFYGRAQIILRAGSTATLSYPGVADVTV